MMLHVARTFAVGWMLGWPALGFGQARRWVPAAPSVDIICWQENSRLTRADFQAPTNPEPGQRIELFGSGITVVLTANATTRANAAIYTFGSGPDQPTEVVVRVEFYRESSWMDQAPIGGRAKALAHEQARFDVVELTGRKLRRLYTLAAADGQDLRAPWLTAEVECVYEEEAALLALYEEATAYDPTPAEQRRWNEVFSRSM